MGEAHMVHAELPDIENVQAVSKEHLLDRVGQMAEQGHRFITATCIDNGERFEVYYHFDRQMKMSHLQVTIDRDEALPSITSIYFCAFVAENEMKDLFGLRINGLTVDYQGRMLVSDELLAPPMRKGEKGGNGDGG